MGALADAALAEGGRVIGVLPRFMDEVEWGHQRLSELILVNDMHERKRLMIQEVDAVIALPGACGTWEELFEAMSFKRLGPVCRSDRHRQHESVLRTNAGDARSFGRIPLHG